LKTFGDTFQENGKFERIYPIYEVHEIREDRFWFSFHHCTKL